MQYRSVPRPLLGLVLLLIIVQLACGTSSVGPTPVPQDTPISGGASTQAAPTSTGQHATPAEAQSMLKAAVQHYQQVGREQALKDFSDKKAPFADRDLYVVCLGSDHKMTANGAYPMLVGLSADSINDSEGRPLGQAVWEVVTAQPEGSMPFHWKNPISGQEESKVLFYQKLDQDVCGVAADQP
ncbi:MAG: cache domain-containing protein [Anaerolineae bacterium]